MRGIKLLLIPLGVVTAMLLSACGSTGGPCGSVSSVSIVERGGPSLFQGAGECVSEQGGTTQITFVFNAAKSQSMFLTGNLQTGTHTCGNGFGAQLNGFDGYGTAWAGFSASTAASCSFTRSATGGTFAGVLETSETVSGKTALLDVAFTFAFK
jgi:hypothetical protein